MDTAWHNGAREVEGTVATRSKQRRGGECAWGHSVNWVTTKDKEKAPPHLLPVAAVAVTVVVWLYDNLRSRPLFLYVLLSLKLLHFYEGCRKKSN